MRQSYISRESATRPKKQICNLQREILRNYTGEIAENDDGQIVIWKTLDCSAKPDGFAVVPHPAVSFVRIEKPSEAVGSRLAIGFPNSRRMDRHQGSLHLAFSQ